MKGTFKAQGSNLPGILMSRLSIDGHRDTHGATNIHPASNSHINKVYADTASKSTFGDSSVGMPAIYHKIYHQAVLRQSIIECIVSSQVAKLRVLPFFISLWLQQPLLLPQDRLGTPQDRHRTPQDRHRTPQLPRLPEGSAYL